MQAQHLDALLMPFNAQGGPSYNAMQVNTWRTAVSSNSGLPAITLLAGYNHNHMPVDMELIGPMYGEGQLLGMDYAYQSHLPPRPLPILKPNKTRSPLLSMSIPQINNLFTLIGYVTYKQYLQHAKQQSINPQDFATLAKKVSAQYKQKLADSFTHHYITNDSYNQRDPHP